MILLSGDIGGTNTRLQITKFLTKDKPQEIVFQKKYPGANFLNFAEIIKLFLQDAKIDIANINATCFAVAGPIKSGLVEFTNLPWVVSVADLRKFLKSKKVALINDFQSIGYGIETLSNKDICTLQKGKYDKNSPVAIIGAGTGIGFGIVTYTDDNTIVSPSEGGHTDFAPVDDEQMDLLKFMRRTYHRVSLERTCCGRGIQNIYKFVVNYPLYEQTESPELKHSLFNAKDKAAEITKYALEKNDPVSLRTLDIFIKIYGAAAGNLALTTLSRRGLYVVGGIAPKLLDQIKDGRFMHCFGDKGRMSDLLNEIPVHIVLNTDVGIQGAALYASRMV